MIAQLSTVRFQRPLKCNGVTPDGTLNYTCFPTGKVETIVSSNPHGVSATYAYDAQNRLNTVVDNRLSGNTTTTYAYDSASNVANDGASTYLYDPQGERKEKSVAGVATDFVLAGGEEIADYYETSATWRLTVRGAGGLPLVTVVPAAGGGSEEIVYVHHDVKGSTAGGPRLTS